MYTIDTFIERLISLREIANCGGETPVVVPSSSDIVSDIVVDGSFFEIAAVELQQVMPKTVKSDLFVCQTGKDNTNQVISIF